eukprot:GFUD01009425.1.p1 GENE.GFUD01009425.1~~GFUD01009425.1.p1  ORF type:complete len:295 (-),score=90.18 GFUD01009425.1:259-1089(-)
MDELERCLLVKQEVFVYKIPPRQSARGYRAADWTLSNPDWTGRMRVMEQNKKVRLKLEDRGSGELFAACPVEAYPGPAIEAVTDSSRYFVIRIMDEGGRSAFIGIGFSDRSDSFDLNVALQDYFKGVKKEDDILKEDNTPKVQLDLAFKEGQTIKVNINIPKSEKIKARGKGGATGMLLPPPPGGMGAKPALANDNNNKVPGTSNLTPLSSPVEARPVIGSSSIDLLCDLGGLEISPAPAPPALAPASVPSKADDPWGDFATAESDAKSSGNWVQF